MRSLPLAALALTLTAAAVTAGDAAKDDLKRLQGDWTVTVMEEGGKNAPEEVRKGMLVRIKDETLPAPAPVPPAAEDVAAAPSPTGVDEKPANFYLGREYDLRAKQVTDKVVEYDARDLTTHGVVVGMTGSGKTGLCISILEEAAIDGIPCIIIDPKGDLTNLLLQFPGLDPADFTKWINEDDARQKGLSVEDYARQIADRWRKGLADSLQGP